MWHSWQLSLKTNICYFYLFIYFFKIREWKTFFVEFDQFWNKGLSSNLVVSPRKHQKTPSFWDNFKGNRSESIHWDLLKSQVKFGGWYSFCRLDLILILLALTLSTMVWLWYLLSLYVSNHSYYRNPIRKDEFA